MKSFMEGWDKNKLRAGLKGIMIIWLMFLVIFLAAQESAISDKTITQKVDRELFFQADVPAHLIDAQTNEGIVMLEGKTNSMLAKERAAKVAMAVKGVRGVVNHIEVEPPYRTDYAIATDVKEALLDDPATESFEVEVAVEDGIVTLAGEVQSWQEKKLTGYVAKGVKGVKGLNNEVEINYASERTDHEIMQDIKQSIARDIRLNQSMINVTVEQGVVNLSGNLGSLNEKYQLRNYAWTAGVKDVIAEGIEVASWAKDEELRSNTYTLKTDEEIKKAIQDAFLYDPRVLSFKPEVEVDNGIVTLSGKVGNLKSKKAAENDARHIVGVIHVYNDLKVRPGAIPDDTALSEEVEEAFFRDSDVERYEIDVTARNGVVYLRGNVDSYFEKFKAEDIASRTRGVIDIVNNLEVEGADEEEGEYYYPYSWNTYYPSPYVTSRDYYDYPMTDAQIKENVVDELWWSPFVNEYQIEVSVDQGVVTLKGTVDTWKERSSAVENAYEGGAKSVVDKMNVQKEAG